MPPSCPNRTSSSLSLKGCVLLASAIIAGLIFLPVTSATAALPLKSERAVFEKHSTSGAGATATLTDVQIDAEIPRSQSRLEELRTRPLPDGIPLQADTPQAATQAEYQEWQRLTARMVLLLDNRIQNLRLLKNIRQAVKDLETQRTGWRGFAEKPPYTMALLDSIQDKIKARQTDIESNEIRLSICEGELADFTSGLRESRNQLRLAEEQRDQNLRKPGEAKSRWQLALANRRNETNEIAAISLENQRRMLQENLAWLRQEISFLDRKFELAAANYRFSREELDRKLKDLDTLRGRLKRDTEDAAKSEESSRAELEKAREALQRYKDTTAASTVTPVLEALRQNMEVKQARVETSSIRLLTLKVMSRLAVAEQAIWQSRYNLVNPQEGAAAPDPAQIKKDIESLQSWKKYLRSRLDGVESLIRSEEARVSSSELSDRERLTARLLLTSHQEQKELIFRAEEQVAGTAQLIQRFAGEVSIRLGQGQRVDAGLKKAKSDVLGLARKIWGFDLYVAEETVVVDGQKIVRSRSVTVGKVIQALLIFFVGIVVARKVVGPVSRMAARKFSLNENDAQVFGRITYYLLFVSVLVFSLVTVKIPLAVFAVLGGGLALGVGFGAQTLINNFISGLILLFDRTISLNDVVEIDGQRGRVTSINIRSSRIKRFDGIEVLVPNSHFLQQNVVNLTLSDPSTRFEVAVGVAYGTPTRTAQELIHRAVVTQPEVRTDPAPFVVFDDFGDSALNFRAFFWIDLTPEINGNIVRSEIRHRISEYLTEAGISIPFPQRDLHLDSKTPLEVTIRGDR